MIGLERSKLNALTPVVKRRVVASISVRGGASLQSSLDLEHSCHNFLLNYAGGLTAGPFLVPARLLNHVLGDSLLNWFGKYYISVAAI